MCIRDRSTQSTGVSNWLHGLLMQPVVEFEGHADAVSGCAFSPDGNHLISFANDCSVRSWDVANGKQCALLHQAQPIRCCAFESSGERLLCGGDESTILTCTMSSDGKLEKGRSLRGHNGSVRAVATSPDGSWIVSGSDDRTAQLWTPQGKPSKVLMGHRGGIRACSFSSDSKTCATAGTDSVVHLWKIPGAQRVGSLKAHSGKITCAVFSPVSDTLLSCDADGACLLSKRGVQVGQLSGNTGAVTSVCFSPSGKMIATASEGHEVQLWRLDDSDSVQVSLITSIQHPGPVTSCAWSPEGSLVASGCADGVLRMWSVSHVLSSPAPSPRHVPVQDKAPVSPIGHEREQQIVTTYFGEGDEPVKKPAVREQPVAKPAEPFFKPAAREQLVDKPTVREEPTEKPAVSPAFFKSAANVGSVDKPTSPSFFNPAATEEPVEKPAAHEERMSAAKSSAKERGHARMQAAKAELQAAREAPDDTVDAEESRKKAANSAVSMAFHQRALDQIRNKKGIRKPDKFSTCLLYTSPSPRDRTRSRMPSSA
eukprot:TRINITY_DN5522_c0_g1_i1.p1 TRINITY_DN5522_c0_g1~~TRINITY_DN5522_c0_g1_i1.p1  ORF type:complete len:540 (+),score=122.57 TRINITY_DN5522_c0_g1_i1:94-1713(+)